MFSLFDTVDECDGQTEQTDGITEGRPQYVSKTVPLLFFE